MNKLKQDSAVATCQNCGHEWQPHPPIRDLNCPYCTPDEAPKSGKKPKPSFQPVLHPGQVLDAEMQRRGIETADPDIRRLIAGKREVDEEMAKKLAMLVGISPIFWLNLQARFNRKG